MALVLMLDASPLGRLVNARVITSCSKYLPRHRKPLEPIRILQREVNPMSQAVDTTTMSHEMAGELRLRFPAVRRVVLEEGFDSTGDRALFVWVLLGDKVEDAGLSWSAIEPIVDAARELAQARADGAWPYVRVRREREWAERNLLPEEAAA